MKTMLPRRDADELGERVVHVKHLVVKDVVENLLRVGIAAEHIAIHRETAGGLALGNVQEREQRVIGLLANLDVIEAMPGNGGDFCRPSSVRARRMEHRRRASMKQHAMTELVQR